MRRLTLRTPLCDLLGISYPVLLAGMGPTIGRDAHGVAGPQLVAAVSNAGGLGVLGGTGFGGEQMRREIVRIRELTDQPFGVDILLPAGGLEPPSSGDPRQQVPEAQRTAIDGLRRRFDLPEVTADLSARDQGVFNPSFDPQEQVDVICEMEVPVVAFGLGSPAPYIDQVHAAGALAMGIVGSPTQAERVAGTGVDLIVAQGSEAGGHTGSIGTLALLPQVLDAVRDLPVVAAGGIGDGRGLAAVLALGCAGAWCGSVFIATVEAQLDDLLKQRILDARAEDTRVTRLFSGKTMRNITNELIEAYEDGGIEALPFGLQDLAVADLLAAAEQAGRHDLLMNAAGQISGMLTQLRPAREVLEGMVAEAADILANRLPKTVRVHV